MLSIRPLKGIQLSKHAKRYNKYLFASEMAMFFINETIN